MGYLGFSRSERSQSSIDNFEIPLSLFKRKMINDFLNENKSNITEDDFNYLKSLSVQTWKSIAKKTGRSSWHHTSKFYNQTDHYDLFEVMEEILNSKDEIKMPTEKTTLSEKFSYGKIIVSEFDKRKYLGDEEYVGIVQGNWLYYLNQDTISKFKIDANKVVSLTEYEYFTDLIEKNPKYEEYLDYFNTILKTRKLNEVDVEYEKRLIKEKLDKVELENSLKIKKAKGLKSEFNSIFNDNSALKVYKLNRCAIYGANKIREYLSLNKDLSTVGLQRTFNQVKLNLFHQSYTTGNRVIPASNMVEVKKVEFDEYSIITYIGETSIKTNLINNQDIKLEECLEIDFICTMSKVESSYGEDSCFCKLAIKNFSIC